MIINGKIPKAQKMGVEEIIETIRKKPFIENVKELLSELNFEFISSDSHQFSPMPWQHPSHKKYQWMVRKCLHRIEPRVDFDWWFRVGIRFLDFRSPKIIIYVDNKFIEEIKKPWKVPVEVNAKKKKVPLTFPDEMSIQDRIDWRKSHKRFSSGKSLGKEEKEYYLRFKGLIGNLDKEFDHLPK